ncbi:uncharacterized protein LOC107045917 [Diachasma alloeum]|uniref:uncharacterized protein LOC107045917 n=1 Tax=Diachasma alloeum TaxID=454923 RepID=UPI0007382C90|nr:uncharacterized protein LOC107045917 [Diachasma alloeum]
MKSTQRKSDKELLYEVWRLLIRQHLIEGNHEGEVVSLPIIDDKVHVLPDEGTGYVTDKKDFSEDQWRCLTVLESALLAEQKPMYLPGYGPKSQMSTTAVIENGSSEMSEDLVNTEARAAGESRSSELTGGETKSGELNGGEISAGEKTTDDESVEPNGHKTVKTVSVDTQLTELKSMVEKLCSSNITSTKALYEDDESVEPNGHKTVKTVSVDTQLTELKSMVEKLCSSNITSTKALYEGKVKSSKQRKFFESISWREIKTNKLLHIIDDSILVTVDEETLAK